MVVNRSAPRTTVVPILVDEDVGKAIDWLCDTSFSQSIADVGLEEWGATPARPK